MTREEAIEIVKKNWPEGRHQIKEALEFLVPELKESEDEKTRKAIISTIENTTQLDWNISKEKMLAWLEKQKEQKLDIEICPRTKSKSFTEVYMKGWNDAKKEQKPTDDRYMEGYMRGIGERNFAQWSEEEKLHLYNAIEAVKCVYDVSEGTGGYKCVEFLKSLRPQSRWKPTEEQMNALEFAKDAYERSDIRDALHDLFFDLKKL